ncbi:MAG: Mce-associated rane protein [Mycobacterium sp.]|jgi:Mce-associated membrane protein|nr:Mce-associated rane protein [Mycobacterium sp.]
MTTLNEATVTATRGQGTTDADAEESETVSLDDEPTTEYQTAQEESEVVDTEALTDDDDEDDDEADDEPETARARTPIAWSRVFAFGVLPAIALVLALAAGYFKWLDVSGTEAALARTESVRVASEDTVALLSYTPESADKDLNAARERLTGEFKDAYTALTRQVVIPGAKEKRIAAVAKVNAAASVSASADHAVVLLYVNQTVTVGDGGTPTDTQPVVRVTLEKVNGRWLVSHFDPV